MFSGKAGEKGLTLDYNNPLTYGLIHCGIPDGSLRFRDLVRGVRSTPAGTITSGAHARFGRGLNNANSGSAYISTGDVVGSFRNRAQTSIAMIIRPDGLPGAADTDLYFMEPNDNSSNNLRLSLGINNGLWSATGTKFSMHYRVTRGGTRRDVNAGAGGTTVSAGTTYVVVGTIDTDTDVQKLYLNGALEASTAFADATPEDTAPFVQPRILNATDGTAPANGTYFGLWIWKRALSAGEVAKFSRDPFATVGTQEPADFRFDSVSGAVAAEFGNHSLNSNLNSNLNGGIN